MRQAIIDIAVEKGASDRLGIKLIQRHDLIFGNAPIKIPRLQIPRMRHARSGDQFSKSGHR